MRPPTPRRTLTLLAIPLAGWLVLSTGFATEMDTKPDSTKSGKATVEAAKKDEKKENQDAQSIPVCGPGLTPIGGSVDAHWASAKSASKPSCQPPAGQAQAQAPSGPVNTLEDIYMAASAQEVLETATPKKSAPESGADSPR